MATAIKIENLSKIYRLGEIGTGTISRDIERWVRMNVLRRDDPFLRIGETNDRSKKGSSDVVYSLRDINFEIEQGDAVGIIGRNGAGKSTLLKILSRVTAPTTGRITLEGRVASLLEVGTGFHPELTGRENIYLNGAIQGMRKKEIDSKLDEIIDFSGVERYIDTPVKRYSSGMYVRLAFAVAAHLESEILIVDEVLAVGDAEFQKKCLGKMGEVSKGEGRTVLFVSHNLNAIASFCKTGIIIKNGWLAKYSKEIDSLILEYSKSNTTGGKLGIWHNDNMFSDFNFTPVQFKIIDSNGNVINKPIRRDEIISVSIQGKVEESSPLLCIGIAVFDEQSNPIFWSYYNDENESGFPKNERDLFEINCTLPNNLFNEGIFEIRLIASLHFQRWILSPDGNAPSIYFEIKGGLSKSPYWISKRPGLVAPAIKWNFNFLEECISNH